MASVYYRKDSTMIWVRLKKNGKWKGERTAWKVGDRAGEKKARQFAAQKSLEELAQATQTVSGNFSDWVEVWLLEQYGARKTKTYSIYTQQWERLSQWLEEKGLKHPLDITRECLSEYKEWRKPRPGVRRKGAGMNTIIAEVRTLGRLLKEASIRGYCDKIVTRDLGWEPDERREFAPWTDAEIETALKASKNLTEKRKWIRPALILGIYQAARSGQCEVPLTAFDFEQGMIFWPKSVMKGKRKDWVQPMDPRAALLLKPIVEERSRQKKRTLADRPPLYALDMRRWLDQLGIPKVAHGLRSTWITKAALAGVPQAVAMAYVHHSGEAVHRLYQRIKPSQSAEFLSQISFGKN